MNKYMIALNKIAMQTANESCKGRNCLVCFKHECEKYKAFRDLCPIVIKSTPRKLNDIYYHKAENEAGWDYIEADCPNCGGYLTTSVYDAEWPKYCWRCGQALDWSDEDEWN